MGCLPVDASQYTQFRPVLESIQKSSIFIAAQKLSFDFSFTKSMSCAYLEFFRSSEIFIDNVISGPQELRR
jgi:hypothetical protein